MSEPDDSGGSTPTASPDESTELEISDVAETIERYRHDLGAAHADAMEALTDERGIENERELYRAAGFDGQRHTIELDVFDAEMYALLDLLDRLTDRPQPASNYVTIARLTDAVVDATPPGLIADWLERDADDLEAPDRADDQPANDDAGNSPRSSAESAGQSDDETEVDDE